MRRREFITLLGGAAATWPVAARAQQGARVRRVGVLMLSTSDHPESQTNIAAFLQGLQEAGWSVGRNLLIDYRWSGLDRERMNRHAKELIALDPDVVLAGTGGGTPALQRASRTVPIVFAQGLDPVGGGSVQSLSRPGTNATGLNQFEYSFCGKWLELLREISPQLTRAAVFRDYAGTVGIANGPLSRPWPVRSALS
jgi:putative ABC transport system substrate-binding protein